MKIFDKLFELEVLKNNPPVLIDIGASGSINEFWKDIAKHSICIAFDADDREFGYIESQDSNFKKLITFNCILSDNNQDKIDFYLTKSPFCSSTLAPDNESLNQWEFGELFEVEKVIKLENRTLPHVLESLELGNIDWFKTDSQGTDLRLFESLKIEIRDKVIIAEFEPGIIDGYKGEDKLHQVLNNMDNNNFWLTDFDLKGVQRYSKILLEKYNKNSLSLKASPCWGELTFMNTFQNEIQLDLRSILLGWIFSTIKGQHGFALELLLRSEKHLEKEIFEMLLKYSENELFPVEVIINNQETEISKPSFITRVKNKLRS